jgi:hypothetical protein
MVTEPDFTFVLCHDRFSELAILISGSLIGGKRRMSDFVFQKKVTYPRKYTSQFELKAGVQGAVIPGFN